MKYLAWLPLVALLLVGLWVALPDRSEGVILVQTAAGAATPVTQVLLGNPETALPTTAATNYAALWGTQVGDFSTTETHNSSVISADGTLTDLRVKLTGDIGDAGDNMVFTIRVEGGDSSPLVSCTITGSTGTEDNCQELAAEVSVTAGDWVSMEIETQGTPTSREVSWSTVFVGDNSNESLWGGAYLSNSTSSNRYGSVSGSRASPVAGASINNVYTIPPVAVTLTGLYVRLDTALTQGSRTYTVYIDGAADTDLECTIDSGVSSPGDIECADTSGPISLPADPNGLIAIQDAPTDTPESRETAYGLRVTNTDQKFIASNTYPARSTSTKYTPVSAGFGAVQSSESGQQQVSSAFTAEDFSAWVDTVPGTGNSYTVTLRDDGGATGCACTIGATDNFCADGDCSASIAAGSLLSIQWAPSGTPDAVTGLSTGVSGTVP
jgi:hypothetical protein